MEQEGRILTGRDFAAAEWKERMSASVGLAEEPEAQEALLNYIKNLGGVREDVFSYLMVPRFPDTASVAAAAPLLCYAAPVEWIALSAEAAGRDQTAGVLYVNEIAEAYRAGVSIEEAEGCLKRAKTAFEMCRYIRECRKKQELPASMARNRREEPPAGAERKEREEIPAAMTQSDMVGAVTAAVTAVMQKFIGAADGKQETYRDGTASGREELPASMTRSDREELPASVTRSDREGLPASVTRSGGRNGYADMEDGVGEGLPVSVTRSGGRNGYTDMEDGVGEGLPASVTRSGGRKGYAGMEDGTGEGLPASMARSSREEEAPDFPDGTEAGKLLVTDLYEAEKQAGKRISFFQMLLSRHLKRAFSRLDREAQETRLFEIMVGRRYGKGKIVAVRRLMNGGMSNEFIFSLLEADLPEEELTGLCKTLLPEETAGTGEKGTDNGEKEEKDSEEEV